MRRLFATVAVVLSALTIGAATAAPSSAATRASAAVVLAGHGGCCGY